MSEEKKQTQKKSTPAQLRANKKYRQNHKEKYNKYQLEYYQKNKSAIAVRRKIIRNRKKKEAVERKERQKTKDKNKKVLEELLQNF